jgi:hypothetical protein
MSISSLFFTLGGVVAGFITVILMAISNQRFLKGEIKEFIEKLILGAIFTYSAIMTQFIVQLLNAYGSLIELVGNIFVYVGFVFFFLAASDIYEISKVLGFAPEKTRKKLKKILGS